MSANTLKLSKTQLRNMRRRKAMKQNNSVSALKYESTSNKNQIKTKLKDLEKSYEIMFSKWIKLNKKSSEFCARRKLEYDKEFGAKGSLSARLKNMYKIQADELFKKI